MWLTRFSSCFYSILIYFSSKFVYGLSGNGPMAKIGLGNSDYCPGAFSVSLYICIEINVNKCL